MTRRAQARAPATTTAAQRRSAMAEALRAVARNERTSVAVYGNLTTNAEHHLSRRLLSRTGFPEEVEVTYLTPSSTAVEVGLTPRDDVNRVVFHPIGWQLDLARLTSPAQSDKLVHDTPQADGSGLLKFPLNRDYRMPGYVDEDGTTREKIVTAVRDMVGPRAFNSWHFLVTRAGDLIVGAAFDDRTTLSDDPAHTIDIAYESLLIAWYDQEATHIDQRVKLIDAPFTVAQSRTMSILIAKLENACPQWDWTVRTTGAGLTSKHLLNAAANAATEYDGWTFTNNAWSVLEGIPFDYSESDFSGLGALRDEIPQFDLATEVFRPAQDVDREDMRAVARTAINTQDTLGTSSATLANYAYISARARGAAMLDAPRTAFIMRRANAAVAAAAGAASSVSHIESTQDTPSPEAAPSTPTASAPVTDSPFVFDFNEGYWGDRNPV